MLAATDLGDHLACPHLTSLGQQVAHEKIDRPPIHDPLLELLSERGLVHEVAYRALLEDQGKDVVTGPSDPTKLGALLRDGPDVIYQPVFHAAPWSGRADFLVRVDRPAPGMAWSYEVVDTKLSAETRAGAVLQLCVYSDLLERVQGIAPVLMHVVHPGPGFPTDSYRFVEFSAFARRLCANLEEHARSRPNTYPEPVEHCGICHWRTHCEDQRRRDDHLSLIAGMSRRHARVFASHGATTVVATAQQVTPLSWRPESGSERTFEKLAHQARLQVAARSLPFPPWELLPRENERGLARLPEPAATDVFIDFEGDPFIGDHGREFLFGVVMVEAGTPGYRRWWAFNEDEERQAYEELIDLLVAQIREHPSTYIYHFAPYEPSALSRLRGKYASRGDELEALFLARRFVDLYAVVRQAVRIGVESYGLKSLEPVIGFVRARPLTETSPFHRRVLAALRRDLADAIEPAWIEPTESYNRDDCAALVVLRDWLEARRRELLGAGESIERPQVMEDVGDQKRSLNAILVEQLLDGLPAQRNERDRSQDARWTLAQLVEWYSREARVAYAESHRRSELDNQERLEDAKSISGLVFRKRIDTPRASGLPTDVYDFPAQELQMLPGDRLVTRHGQVLGEITKIDLDDQRIEIKKTRASIDDHPASAYVWETVGAGPKEAALLRLAHQVAYSGFAAEPDASLAHDLLMGVTARGLRVAAGSLRKESESLLEEGESLLKGAQRLASQLNATILPIQGPPGTGKTEISARMVLELVKAGKRVGITATSHKVILNLVERVTTLARQQNALLRVLVKNDDDGPSAIPTTHDPAEVERRIKRLHVVGATAWQWSRKAMAKTVDVLIIDEAGQMSLTDALAVCGSTSSLVLVGDPMQLQQPIQASHPEGLATSCLTHLLRTDDLVSPDKGLFLDVTYRLHPTLAQFTSEQFYGGRLASGEAARARTLSVLDGPGTYFLPVEHEGNQSRSREEAEAIVSLVRSLIAPNGPLSAADVLVVAPYNAHVALVRDAMVNTGLGDVRVGTVDKFQGQEASVAIYSMATSSPEDAPRGMDFLYDRHRLNTATSRARVAAILVACPRLLSPACRTPEHLRLASALSRFVELAHVLRSVR